MEYLGLHPRLSLLSHVQAKAQYTNLTKDF